MVVLPYLFFLINLVLGFQEYIFLLHVMCRYQCDEAVTKNDITSQRKGRLYELDLKEETAGCFAILQKESIPE